MNKIVRIAVALLILSLLAVIVVNVVSAEGGIAQRARKFNACQFRWVETEPVRVAASDEGYLFDCSFYEGTLPSAEASVQSQICSPLDGEGYIGAANRVQTRASASVLDFCGPQAGEGFWGPAYRGGETAQATTSCGGGCGACGF